ncbi:MAG: TonB-dependent receptor [Bryobacteraceae bacterium]|nr:TonB-dependent receptor [Bryobacteraceae bacterium]
MAFSPIRFILPLLPLCRAIGQQPATLPDVKPAIPPLHTSIVITAKPIEPSLDYRNAAVFQETLFSRDDQVFHQLNAGLNAGQHEGGGKSIEIRRFGFNLDHGGVNGGLKVLVDNVQQNQPSQGHGQGYLGSLKSLTPELIQEARLINGPFSPEYGDFSGLGVVHIQLRESLPDQWTVRMQGGSFHSQRGFLAFSPDIRAVDSFLAYEGSHSDGPFIRPLNYRRDNLTANFTRRLDEHRSFAVKMNGGRNDYDSSGQIPLAEVDAGRLDAYGSLDPGDGGRTRNGTVAGYYRHELGRGAMWKVDAFLARSLLDMYSNFTFFLNDPVNGDGIQQHDSRLQQGVNAQYSRPHRVLGRISLLTAGGNFHANQVNVGLFPRVGRDPIGVTTRANVNVGNGAGYVQESLSLLGDRLQLSGGLRWDVFRFGVRDRVTPEWSATEWQGSFQPKAAIAYTLSRRIPVTLHANYGRGISSTDARSLTQAPGGTKIATTDFYQAGAAGRWERVGVSAAFFWIDRSNELVYIADDGSLEFLGPSRAYGVETKASFEITRRLSFSGGVTKVFNSFYRGTSPRIYVDRAPQFVANAGLTLSAWRGWSGSLRMRAINRYRLDGENPTIAASGHTVVDLSVVRRIRRGLDLNFAIDNVTDRFYYETQNYLESRPAGRPAAFGIHGTPGYPLTVTVGIAFRFRGK